MELNEQVFPQCCSRSGELSMLTGLVVVESLHQASSYVFAYSLDGKSYTITIYTNFNSIILESLHG